MIVDTGKAGIHNSKYGAAWQLPDNIWQQNQNCRRVLYSLIEARKVAVNEE